MIPTELIKSLSELESLEKGLDLLKDAPPSTLQLIERGASRSPDKLALRFIADPTRITESTDWTFSELLYRIREAANTFRDAGINEGDAISIVLPNCLEYHPVLWG